MSSNEFTIDEFYQKKMFHEINTIIHNGIYYHHISNFRKLKIRKHGRQHIFFNYVKNNKTEIKSLHLHKLITPCTSFKNHAYTPI